MSAESSIFLIGLLLAYPFIKWPMDAHFGVFCRWALFREPGDRLPLHLIRGNQGFGRIFVHYVGLIACRLLGRKAFQTKIRGVQAVFICLSAVALFVISRYILQLDLFSAYVGSLLFLVVYTRPQLDFMAVNAEPFYVFVEALGVCGLLLYDPDSVGSLLVVGAAFFVMTFAALNAKIVFLINPLLMGLLFLVIHHWHPSLLVVMALAYALSILCFGVLFRKYLSIDSFGNLRRYAKWAKSHNGWASYKNIYSNYLAKTPLLVLPCLSIIGMAVIPFQKAEMIIAGWCLSSLLTIFAQQRLANYHFQILLFPWSLFTAVALNGLYRVHPLCILVGVFIIIWFGRTAYMDLPTYYLKRPIVQHLTRALGASYVHFYDFRLDEIASHYKQNPGPFLAWGIAPQLHCLTGQRPYVYIAAYLAFVHEVNPLYQEALIRAVTTVRHPWIYDLSFNDAGSESFNPLALYAGTGLQYIPRDRKNNVVYYEFAGSRSNWKIRPTLSFYVKKTPALDLFHQELAWAGYDPERLGKPFDTDILPLVRNYITGKRLDIPRLADEDGKLWRRRGDVDITDIFGAAIFCHRGDTDRGRLLLQRWHSPQNPYPAMSPSLSVAAWTLCKALGVSRDGPFPLQQDTLNQIKLYETVMLAEFLSAVADSDIPTEQEKYLILDVLSRLRVDQTPYTDRVSETRLRDLSKI